MKKAEDQPPMQNRRRFLAALFASPLLLSSISYGKEKKFPVMQPVVTDGFVIVNGWVLLKQDIAGYEEPSC